MLKNKVKILLMSLLLHIELQNFLNSPRMSQISILVANLLLH